jgi:WD40 repeat protein
MSVAFSPDGKQLVTGEAKFIKIWDIVGAKEVRRIEWGSRTALAVAFSADGKQVTAVGDDGKAASWLAANGKEVRTFALPLKMPPSGPVAHMYPLHQDPFSEMSLTTDGNWFAVASQQGPIHLVNMATGKKVAFADGQPGNHSTLAFAFTPDSKHLITASDDDRLQIWEARSGKLVRTSKETTDYLFWVGVSATGKQVVTLSYSRQQRTTLTLAEWDFATAKQLRHMDLGITPGLPAMSPDGQWLAFGEPNDVRSRLHKTGDAILVDRATGKEVRHFDAGDEAAAQDLTFSASGKILATIGRTGTLRLWDTATGKLLQTMKVEGHEGLTYHLRFAPGDKTVISTSMTYGEKGVSTHIVEWSVATGQAIKRHEGPKNISWCQALSADGKQFAWVGRHDLGLDQQAEVWSVNQQAAQQTCTGLRGSARYLGFSPDGRLLAGGCYDGTILIWGVPLAP